MFDWYINYEAHTPMYRDQEQSIRLDNVEEFKKVNDFIKSIDPKHPTTIQIDDLSLLRLYKDSSDIIEVASFSSSYGESLVPYLVDEIKTIRRVLGPSKPVVLFIGIESGGWVGFRRPKMIRCAAYLAGIHGMNGMIFHVGHKGRPTNLTYYWSVFQGLAREMEFIYPILISPPSPDLPTVTTNDRHLEFRVKKHKDRIYLIACNPRSVPTAPTFRFTGRGNYASATLPFEYRQITLKDGMFTDEFMPYETHVYEVATE